MDVIASKSRRVNARRQRPLRIRCLTDAAPADGLEDLPSEALAEIAARYDVTSLTSDEMDALCQELYVGGWIGFQDRALLCLPGRNRTNAAERCNYLQAWQRTMESHASRGLGAESLRHARRILNILTNLRALAGRVEA